MSFLEAPQAGDILLIDCKVSENEPDGRVRQ